MIGGGSLGTEFTPDVAPQSAGTIENDSPGVVDAFDDTM